MDKQRNPVPGADYVTTKKSSRRKKKTASKDETSEAGPSVISLLSDLYVKVDSAI